MKKHIPTITALLFALVSGPALQAQGREIFQERGASVFIVRIEQENRPVGTGSAFILKHRGRNYGITNYHVVAAGDIYLEKDGKKYDKVRILRVNDILDVAVFEFPGIQDLPAVDAVNYQPVEGEKVFALGYPGGISTELRLNITEGLVSNSRLLRKGPGGMDYFYVQISAALNHGNSGGPVFGEKGQVIGMATVGRADLNQIGWAVPCEEIVREIERIKPTLADADEAEVGVKERLNSLTQTNAGFPVFWNAYSPSSRHRGVRDAQRSAERIRQSVILSVPLVGKDGTASDAFLREMGYRLKSDDFFFFYVLHTFMGSNKNQSFEGIRSSPPLLGGMYLATYFYQQFTKQMGRGDHKYDIKSYRIISLSYDEAKKSVDAMVEFQTETDRVTLLLKFEKEWGTWFLVY